MLSFRRSAPMLGVIGLLFAFSQPWLGVRADNGDLLATSTALSGKEYGGICADSDGTFWAVGETTAKIAHLDGSLVKIGEITNPHGAGSFPNYILSRGITFRPSTQTFLVLAKNGADFKVKEVDRSGNELTGGAFTINAAAYPTANLFSLAYDPVYDQLWTVDDNNDQIFRVTLAGAMLAPKPYPKDVPTETILHGSGISFRQEGSTPYIYITYGDIFTLAPSRILELTVMGNPTGIEIPLENVPPPVAGEPVKKIGALQMGTYAGKNAALVIGEKGVIHAIEFLKPDPVPPTFLKANVSQSNEVELSWENHGGGPSGSYTSTSGIQIKRDGIPKATLTGTRTSWIDEGPLDDGSYLYTVQGSNGGPYSPVAKIQVVVGKGALLNWIPFPILPPQSQPFDIAVHPDNGEIYVTDAVAGRILHFDQNLQYIDDVPSPFPNPGGIAFNPNGTGGKKSLMVATASGVLMREIDLTGAPLDLTVPIDFQPISNPKMGGLVYNPATLLYTCIEINSKSLVSFDKNGNQSSSCTPPQIFTDGLNEGIGFDKYTQNFHATFDGGMVRELYASSCSPTNFNFSLESLGELAPTPDFVKGIDVAENTIFIASVTANAIFHVLISPQGQTFVRGDLNRDLTVNLSDVVIMAEYLFRSGPKPFCLDAVDTNDDGELDISDPVYSLFFLFVPGSPPPPAPYPNQGHDPTFLDNLKC